MKGSLSLLLSAALLMGTAALFSSCGNDSAGSGEGGTVSSSVSSNGSSGEGNPIEPSLLEKDPALQIVELMVNNEVGVTADDGKRYAWIELLAKRELELSDYSLVCGDGAPAALPAAKLAAGQRYLIFAGKDISVDLTESASLTLMHADAISQSFVYINRGANCSYLVAEGCESTTPTPGYENVRDPDRLVISELMCDNKSYPVDGVIGDWIELYNAGESDIDLAQYYVSDKLDTPYLCALPELVLGAGEYAVLRGDHELTFGLSSNGETLYLTRRDGVVSSMVMYGAIAEDSSFKADSSEASPSPGYPNTAEGYFAYVSSRKGLVINEVITTNTKYKKYSSDYHDMVELYNNTDGDISLSEYYLTDKAKNLVKYKLPDVTLGAGKYYIVYCTGLGGSDPSFSLSSEGETVILSRSDGYICDSIAVPGLMTDISYGRYGGKLVYFEKPTFGALNSSGYERVSGQAGASVASGEYDREQTVYLSGDGDIYYTTDGTKPTTSSQKYSGEGIKMSSSGTIRTVCKEGSLITGEERSFTYFINTPDYTLPKIMVSVGNEKVFGSSGMYTKSSKSIEAESRVSFYVDGKEEFAISCGLKLFGGSSVNFAKKSFQLKFRAKYGESKLRYKMFENSDVDTFNSIVLRAGGQAQYRSMISDEVGSSLASTSGNMPTLMLQHYRPVNLYINDTYMGVYFIREKIDSDFAASYLGGEPEQATVVDFWNGCYLKDGNTSALNEWKELYSFVQKNDMTLPENYEYVKARLDIDSMIDFYVIEMFCANTDCGNVRVCKSDSEDSDGKWRYILFDLDLSFIIEKSGANTYLGSVKVNSRPFNPIIYNLLKNDEFCEYFYARLDMHMKSTISNEAFNARVDHVYNEIAHDMYYDIERWKNVTDNSGMNRHQTVEKWKSRVDALYTRGTPEYLERLKKEIDTAVNNIRK